MAEQPWTILLCSCDDTMPLDPATVRKGCGGASVATAHQLCRAELSRFRAALAAGGPLTVACTQEAPLFTEVAAEATSSAGLLFANVRESAGWSTEAARAAPKMAALLAAAVEPTPSPPLVSFTSDRRQMGALVSPLWLKIAAWVIAATVIGLNLTLLLSFL